jgi:hypothetical protein
MSRFSDVFECGDPQSAGAMASQPMLPKQELIDADGIPGAGIFEG